MKKYLAKPQDSGILEVTPDDLPEPLGEEFSERVRNLQELARKVKSAIDTEKATGLKKWRKK